MKTRNKGIKFRLLVRKVFYFHLLKTYKNICILSRKAPLRARICLNERNPYINVYNCKKQSFCLLLQHSSSADILILDDLLRGGCWWSDLLRGGCWWSFLTSFSSLPSVPASGCCSTTVTSRACARERSRSTVEVETHLWIT